jgi:phospholipase C
MSSCTKWTTNAVITCKNWATQVDYECTKWADEGSNQCSQWADEGSNQCSQWADEGSNSCTSWEECHWYTPWNCIAGFFCRAWYWVAKWVCKAWYWVAKWVCKAWYWVAKWVCKAFAWVVKAVCIVFGWIVSLVCVAWDTVRCAMLSLLSWLRSIFGGGRERPPRQIQHVFVLALENRSFDHMFGFSGLAGVDENGNPTTVNGADPTRDTNVKPGGGGTFPVSTPAEFQLKNVDLDPGHEFDNTVVSLCGEGVTYDRTTGVYPPIGNSGFIANYADAQAAMPERVMHCFTAGQLPVLTTLASEFALCDQWFSSLPGPTWPNRFFLVAASSGGLDDSPSTLDIVTATTVEGYRFSNGNIFDLLDDYCIEWKIFEGDEFPVTFALRGMNLNALQGRFEDFDEFESKVQKSSFGPKFVFIEPKYGGHDFDVTGPGDFTCGNSMHPLDDVTRGEKLVKTVYEAIRNSPHWETSLLIVTFDEHGGFYDHVPPPPAVPPGDSITTSYVKKGFRFDQLGVRVPALIISPYVARGVIDHTLYDHSSVLATVERLFGMKNLTERDKAANDVLHLLSLSTRRTDAPTRLPDPAINPNPLPCDDEAESEDTLLTKRSELRDAQRTGRFRDRPIAEFEPTSTQIGFTQVALLKVLQTAEYPERDEWIAQYKAITNGVDAALFMTEAKLKILHGIDLKRFNRADNPDKSSRLRTRAKSSS